MSFPALREIFESHKEEILREVIHRIRRFPWSPYQQFLVHTEEGRRRLRIFVDLFGRALQGERQTFVRDQERVGYARALMEGFGPEVLTQFYSQVPDVLWNTLQETADREGVLLPGLCREIQDLNDILFRGYSSIVRSYLKVRDERITEKVNELHALQRFTQEIISLLELDQLVGFILRRMTDLFGVEEAVLAVFLEGRIQGLYHHPPGRQDPEILPVVEKTCREEAIFFLDEAGDVFGEIDHDRLKRVASVPIRTRGRVYGVLCLCNRVNGFTFTSKELEFLNQFLYIMAVALENAFMLKEVEQAREALRLLTGKMITIQEEERRRLAADIHDTLTQTLIGIGYKIQFCKELPNRRPEMLDAQLDSLLRTVHQAIDQSRNLISSLRPDLIDTMGLVPALRRHVKGFTRETGIRVKTRFPRRLRLSSEVNICLFRVAQEALMNVYKHAETNEAGIDLRTDNGNLVFTVSDEGRGFEVSSNVQQARDRNKLGLLSIQERIESIGGRVAIDAGTNRGCSIRVIIPHGTGRACDGQDQGDDR